MNMFDRQYNETAEQFAEFKKYLEDSSYRKGNLLTKCNWAERKEAYNRYMEKKQTEARSLAIQDSANKYVEDLQRQITALSLTTSIYHKALKNGGMEELEELDILTKRTLSMEDQDHSMKSMRFLREILALTPEGREILASEPDKEGRVIININPAPSREEVKRLKEIDITPEEV